MFKLCITLAALVAIAAAKPDWPLYPAASAYIAPVAHAYPAVATASYAVPAPIAPAVAPVVPVAPAYAPAVAPVAAVAAPIAHISAYSVPAYAGYTSPFFVKK